MLIVIRDFSQLNYIRIPANEILLSFNPFSVSPLMGTYKHIWSKTQLTTKFKGVVTLKDIFASCDERVGDERFDIIEFILNDYTQVDEISGSILDISNALTYSNQSKLFGRRENMLVAIVAPKIQVREKVELFLQLDEKNDHSWKRRYFDSIEDAESWAYGILHR